MWDWASGDVGSGYLSSSCPKESYMMIFIFFGIEILVLHHVLFVTIQSLFVAYLLLYSSIIAALFSRYISQVLIFAQ